MTAPKRWYQLSMLQLLVAMAVVAVLCWFNLTATISTEDLSDLGLQVVEYRAGWPFTYRKSKAIAFSRSSNSKPTEAGKPTYLLRPLATNLLVGLLISGAIVSLLGIAERRKSPCPFPST